MDLCEVFRFFFNTFIENRGKSREKIAFIIVNRKTFRLAFQSDLFEQLFDFESDRRRPSIHPYKRYPEQVEYYLEQQRKQQQEQEQMAPPVVRQQQQQQVNAANATNGVANGGPVKPPQYTQMPQSLAVKPGERVLFL